MIVVVVVVVVGIKKAQFEPIGASIFCRNDL